MTAHHDLLRAIPMDDSSYPVPLLEIHDPPKLLYVRGDIPNFSNAIAIVGSRKNTAYGKHITEEVVRTLVHAGGTIVSGLALGIDGIAHETALQANGTTVAILGSGIDDASLTPHSHVGLGHRILDHGGAIFSEYPPGTSPTRFTYPRRNRIIAGLCRATIVIEAAEGSGALITAQCALENGRDVFAIPQNITSPTSFGVNELIASGATPVIDIAELPELLSLRRPDHPANQEKENKNLSPIEGKLLSIIQRDPLHVDAIIHASGMESSSVMSTLTVMEIEGSIRHLGGMMYART